MKERPILFSAPMVRALLDGTKAQTRRVVKRIPWLPGVNHHFSQARPFNNAGEWRIAGSEEMTAGFRCPYGQPGDRLWVRETWQQVHPLQVADDRYSQAGRAGIPGPPPVEYRTIYRADGEFPPIYSLGGEPWPYRSLEPFERDGMPAFVDHPCWTPSIHMPRWASRLVLEITDVRVQRLNEITEADAIAEGATPSMVGADLDYLKHRAGFQSLWNAINGANAWDANPWVWALTFSTTVRTNG